MSTRLGIFILGMPLFAACSMSLDRNIQQSLAGTPNPQRSGRVHIAERANGLSGKVGWGRFSLIYLPIAPVNVDGEPNQKVMETVVEALRISGYEPIQVEPNEKRAAVVTCDVEQFWFNNFTYFAPFWVPAWGDARLRVSVTRDGSPIWTETFSSSGRGNGLVGGFSEAGNNALGQIMGKMAQAFVSDEFYRAVRGAPAPAEATFSPAKPPAASTEPAGSGCSTEHVLAMKRKGVADDLIRRACRQEGD